MSMVRTVIGGVDTHADFHVAAAIDGNGAMLGIESFSADAAGHEELLGWLASFGAVTLVGVEGTGSWGVGLARFLHDQEVETVEVDRPNRQKRRKRGKSDPIDAEAAARAALSGEASVTPKTRNGPIEQMRVLLVARRSARTQRIQTLNQLRHLVFCGPEPIRVRFKDRYKTGLVSEATNMRPRNGSDPVTFTTNTVIRILARRIQGLNTEMASIDQMLTRLVAATAPSLLELHGVGALGLAQRWYGQVIRWLPADARNIPLADDSIDIVTCSLFLHHFGEADAVLVLREAARVARLGIVIDDLSRSRVALVLTWFATRILSRSRA